MGNKPRKKCEICRLIVSLATATRSRMMKISSNNRKVKLRNSMIVNVTMKWYHSKLSVIERNSQLINRLLALLSLRMKILSTQEFQEQIGGKIKIVFKHWSVKKWKSPAWQRELTKQLQVVAQLLLQLQIELQYRVRKTLLQDRLHEIVKYQISLV